MFFKKILTITGLLCATFIFAQTAEQKKAPEYALEKDIPYYPETTENMTAYQKERCTVDVYYQKDGEKLPVVVWFHGGGLTGGNKYIPGKLKNQGLVVVGVNYRLSGAKATTTNSIEDAAASIVWTFKNIEKFGGDPNKIFISGHSAGGYLTMMTGLDPKWLGKYDIELNKIAGLIPLSGHTITHMTVRKERGISDKQPIIDEFAPLYHAGTKNPPPMLLMTGDRELEMLGRYEENAYMVRMMKINGNKNVTLYEFQGYGHGMEEPAMPLLLKFVQKISAEKK